jgi:4-hydroxyacetophenone monooxygenase
MTSVPALDISASTSPSTIDDLRRALAVANLPTLILVLHQLTGDPRWLEPPYRPSRPKGLDDHDDAGLAPAVQDEIRAAAVDAVSQAWDGTLPDYAPLTPARLVELLGISLAEEVRSDYGELLAEEMGVLSREVTIDPQADRTGLNVVVVGAGIAGINLGIMLKKAGVPFTIVEKNHEVGGTWLENRYPGCGVDTPSHLYSYSFAKSSRWSSYFGKRDEVEDYLTSLAREHGLYEHIEFGVEATEARFNENTSQWHVELRGDDGASRAVVCALFVSAVGHFNRPNIPAVPGADTFPGPALHTAQWNPELDLAGKRVAVVGSAASAMQFVPAMAGTASKLIVFQRSRQWAVPHPNINRSVDADVQWILEHVPYYAGFYRLRQFWRFGDRLHPALQIDESFEDPDFAVNAANAAHRRFLTSYIASQLEGRPELIAASTPDYPAYGKRPLIDHGWYQALRREDVELIEGGLQEIRGAQLISADGRAHAADVIVWATGFETLRILGPLQVIGRSEVSLHEVWGTDDARAYLGVTVPQFPNFFMLFGPNTNTSHGGSAFLTMEMQVRYVMQLVKTMLESNIRSVECRTSVYDEYNDEVDRALAATVWTHPKVTNYYRNSSGRIVGTSPWEYVEYWRRTRTAQLGDFITDTDGTEKP